MACAAFMLTITAGIGGLIRVAALVFQNLGDGGCKLCHRTSQSKVSGS